MEKKFLFSDSHFKLRQTSVVTSQGGRRSQSVLKTCKLDSEWYTHCQSNLLNSTDLNDLCLTKIWRLHFWSVVLIIWIRTEAYENLEVVFLECGLDYVDPYGGSKRKSL